MGNFYALLADDNARRTILHSFTYSAATACLAVVLALVVAYIVSRRVVRGGGILTALCMAPLVIPGIVLAIGFYAAWAPPPLALYGTAAILVLGFTARFLPIAYVNCAAGLRSLNPEMEGRRAHPRRRAAACHAVRGGAAAEEEPGRIVAAGLHPRHARAEHGDLPGRRQYAGDFVMMLDLSENGSFETLAALGFFLLGATILIVMLGYKLVGRDFMLRRS